MHHCCTVNCILGAFMLGVCFNFPWSLIKVTSLYLIFTYFRIKQHTSRTASDLAYFCQFETEWDFHFRMSTRFHVFRSSFLLMQLTELNRAFLNKPTNFSFRSWICFYFFSKRYFICPFFPKLDFGNCGSHLFKHHCSQKPIQRTSSPNFPENPIPRIFRIHVP